MTSKSDGSDYRELRPKTIARGDPLLRWLSGIEASPILIGIAYTVLLNLVRGFAAWHAGYLRTSGTVTGFFDDPSVYTNLVAGAVVFAYYSWMPRGIVAVFKGMQESNVIDKPTPVVRRKKGDEYDYTSLIEDMQSWFGKWWWPGISLAVAATVTFTLLLPQYLVLGQSAWWTADILPLIAALLWALIGIYCVLLLLFYTILSIVWLRRLFRSFVIRVRPLYPDQAGGLASLGNFTLNLSYIIALIGIMLVVTPITRNYVAQGTVQFRWTTELLAGLIAYMVVAPIVFFGPLAVAHGAMREAKNQLLLQIARRFEDEYINIHSALDPSSNDAPSRQQSFKILKTLQALLCRNAPGSANDEVLDLERSVKSLKELQALYEMTSKFPVWPFNVTNLTRFSTSYLSPVALAVTIELLVGLINP